MVGGTHFTLGRAVRYQSSGRAPLTRAMAPTGCLTQEPLVSSGQDKQTVSTYRLDSADNIWWRGYGCYASPGAKLLQASRQRESPHPALGAVMAVGDSPSARSAKGFYC